MSDSTAPPDKSPKSPKSLGRRIATILLWIFVVYMVSIGFASLVPQALWPEEDAAFGSERCADGIRALRTELHGHRAQEPMSPEARAASSDFTWLERWDTRYQSLSPRCTGAGRSAYAALGQLRQKRELSLRRAVRDQAPLEREIEAYLQREPDREHPSPERPRSDGPSPEQNAEDHD